MRQIFSDCSEAIAFSIENKSFAVFHSEKPTTTLKMHVHDCCELFFCMSDGQSFIINDKVYDVKRGDVFVINPFEAHKVSFIRGGVYFHRYSIHIDPVFLYSNSDGECNLAECFFTTKLSNRVRLDEEQLSEFSVLLQKITCDYDFGDAFYKKLCMLDILYKVNRLFLTNTVKDSTAFHLKAVQDVLSYIDRNYAENITLADIAKNSYLSVTQLCRIFKKYCLTTVMKYLTSKRIAAAKKMLAEGKSVTETAYACGFNDYANFIRTFKSIVKTSPGKYKTDSHNCHPEKNNDF